MSNFYVYALSEPITEEVRYVGQTDNLESRFKQHCRSSKRNITLKEKWIHSLLAVGSKPLLFVLEECSTKKEANAAEIRWIEEYYSERLLNICNPSGASCIPKSAWIQNFKANYEAKGKPLPEYLLLPHKISLRISEEMREQLNELIWPARGITEAAVIRAAIQDYIAKYKKASKEKSL